MRYILLLITLFFIGCQESQKPTILDSKKLVYANTLIKNADKKNENSANELETKKEIAQIEMKKEIESKKIEANAKIETAKIETEKELQKVKLQLKAKEKDNAITKIAITALIILSLGFMLLIYALFKKHQANKLYLEQERLKAQKELKEKELKAQMAQKVMDLIGNKDLTKEQQEKLLSLIEYKNVLEYKK